jgi:hypothetical protein
MILCYCHENVSEGMALLRHAAELHSHPPSMYALSVILRDASRVASDAYLRIASNEHDHLPSWQERLSTHEMRIRFGDVDASILAKYLDPSCLCRLLGRHYVECERTRMASTSHCWNITCGRWAYRSTPPPPPAPGGGGGLGGERRRTGIVGLRAFRNDPVGGEGANNRRPRAAAPRNDDGDGIHDAARQQRGRHNVRARRGILEPINDDDFGSSTAVVGNGGGDNNDRGFCERATFSIESLLLKEQLSRGEITGRDDGTDPVTSHEPSHIEGLLRALRDKSSDSCSHGLRVSRMKMCSSCRRAKYCSKLCQVYDWRSGRHKMECQFL